MHIVAYTMVNVNLIYLLNLQTLLKKITYLAHQVSLSTLSMKRQMIFMDDGVQKEPRLERTGWHGTISFKLWFSVTNTKALTKMYSA